MGLFVCGAVQDTGSKKLEIRQGPTGMYVQDLVIVPVKDMSDVTSLMESGDR